MKISYQILKNFIELPVSAEALAEVFPKIGHEVESVETSGVAVMPHVVVGKILTKNPHPDAERLTVCTVDVGAAEPLQIVCGAKNHSAGDHVPVACIGAKLPGDFHIKKSKLRGVESQGMMCSAKELGLNHGVDGLLILENQPKIGTPIHELFPEIDYIFDLSLTANRADALSHLGVARDLAAYFNLPLKENSLKALPLQAPGLSNGLLKGVEVQSPVAPYYLTLGVSGVKVAESPAWLKAALEKMGTRPINNVVDVTNYLLFLRGQPLHAFDAAKIHGEKLVVRAANQGESSVTLDGEVRKLDPSMLVIADTQEPLVIAGVMGSKKAEVDESTQDIILESAYFEPGNIRKTARGLGLITDSAYRFERGVDPENLLPTLLEAAHWIQTIAGGEVEPYIQVVGESPFKAHTIQTSCGEIEKVLGFAIDPQNLEKVLKALSFHVEIICEGASERWHVTIPTCRNEVKGVEDLAEEYLRIAGTDLIPDLPPLLKASYREDCTSQIAKEKSIHLLIDKGFIECYNYSLNEEKIARLGSSDVHSLKLKNPLASDQSHLRSTLLPGLLETLRFNRSKNQSVERLFEVENIFRMKAGAVEEYLSIGFITAEDQSKRSWMKSAAPSFYEARSILEEVAEVFGIQLLMKNWQLMSDHLLYETGHAAAYQNEEGFHAMAGMLSFEALKAWDTEDVIFAGEFSIPLASLTHKKALPVAPLLSAFPSTSRDLALLVDKKTLAGDVIQHVETIAQEVIEGAFRVESCQIFDVYEGKGIPEDKKSLALSLRFRSDSQTLTDEQVKGYFDNIMARLIADQYQLRMI